MGSISELLKLKGEKEFFRSENSVMVIEGGGIYKEIEYLITFNIFGFRCGYVSINDEDIERDINAYVEITFRGRGHRLKEFMSSPCNDFWIGFDAGHCDDSPCYSTAAKYFPEKKDYYLNLLKDDIWDSEDHKSYEFMENECKSIIEQLRE